MESYFNHPQKEIIEISPSPIEIIEISPSPIEIMAPCRLLMGLDWEWAPLLYMAKLKPLPFISPKLRILTPLENSLNIIIF